MDRVYSQDERIRRAEEIYARRQNMKREMARSRSATLNVSRPKKFKFFKKIILQIVICVLIYCIYHLINTTSYSFSNDVLDKTKGVLSYDTDFYSIYSQTTNSISEFWNKNILSNEEQNKTEEENEENKQENMQNEEENTNQENIIELKKIKKQSKR